MKNQRKKNLLWLKIVAIFIYIILAIMIFGLIGLINNSDNQIYLEGEELFGEFTLYKGDIYASVPSNGEYIIPKADIETFNSISDNNNDQHIALDKNNVYCGNLIIPKLNPKTTVSLGHNYYTDGNSTYYCAPYTVSNDSLSILNSLWQEIQYQFFDTKKPQTYFYPFVELPKSKMKYYAPPLLDRFSPIITDGEFTYYEGKLMQDANPETLVELDKLDEDNRIRESFYYLTDGNNVYFENQKLAITYNESIYSFRLEAQNTKEYIINPKNGMVYLENLSFAEENAPYKIISKYSAHAYQTLFLSKNGVFFCDTQSKSIKKAGENPFLEKNYEEIAPLVFYNGKQTLFVDATEDWVKKNYRMGSGGHLKSRSTIIYKLEENLTHNWQKLGDIKTGTIWKNGGNYFYFDEYGESQLLYHTIYKIKNQELADSIVQNNSSRREISKLIDTDRLIPAKRKEIVEAKTILETSEQTFSKYFYIFIFLIFAIIWVIDKQRKKNIS